MRNDPPHLLHISLVLLHHGLSPPGPLCQVPGLLPSLVFALAPAIHAALGLIQRPLKAFDLLLLCGGSGVTLW